MSNQQNQPEQELLCSICFCPFELTESKYTCADPKCNIMTCAICLEALIIFSEKGNLIPTCPSNDCNGIYIVSSLINISSETIKIYENACLNFFLKDQGDNIKKKIEEKKIVDKIRDERLQFLEQKFPKGIAFVAKLAFTDKLKQLDKQKSNIINLKLKNAQKSCLNSTCNGFLDPNFVCMSCLVEFCNKCEKKLTMQHNCKQEDLDSVNFVNNMIHCPGCKLPIFKNEGCDSITCSNCGINFLYSTGKIGGHGSANAKINVDVTKKTHISNDFSTSIPLDCLPLILQLEALQPPLKSKDAILTPIKLYIQSGKNKNLYARDLSKKIDLYTKFKYNNIHYHKCLVEISDILEKKQYDILKNRLVEIIDGIKNKHNS